MFSHDLLQHVPIQREIRHQAFEFGVLFAQLSQLAQFAQPELGVVPFPHVERLLTDAHLTTHCRDCRPTLRLPQGGQDLLVGMPSLSCHRRVLLV